MSFHQFCMQHKDQMLQQMVNSGIMDLNLANAVADVFAQSGVDFDQQVMMKYGQRVDQNVLMELMNKALRDIATNLLYGQQNMSQGTVTFNPGAFAATTGQISFGTQGQPTSMTSILNRASQGTYFQQPSQTVVSVENNPLANFPTATEKPIKSAPDKNPQTSISIHDKGDSSLTMNQKIAITLEGGTKEAVDTNVITILRKIVEVVQADGEQSTIKFDHLIFNPNKGELCFDDEREVINYLDHLLSYQDITDPYFRVVDLTRLTPIHIPHDTFFDQYYELATEITSLCGHSPSEPMEGRDCLKVIRERLALKNAVFCREMENFLLNMGRKCFTKYFRFSDDTKRAIKLNSLNALDSLMTSNDKTIKDVRDVDGFERVIQMAFTNIYDFVTMTGKVAPIHIDLDHVHKKIPSLDPYVQSRRYIEINNQQGFNSMEFWKYYDKPEVQQQVVELIKKKVLVRYPTRMIITNIYSPVLMRSSLFSGTPNPVLVKRCEDLTAVKKAYGAGGEIISLLNYTHVNGDHPDKLFIKVGDDFKKFNLSSTVQGDMIIVP